LDAVRGASLALLIAVSGLHASLATSHETEARIETLDPFIAKAARRFPVPEAWIRAVIAAESGGRTELDGKPITSPAGAMGPMQVMPATYEEMRQHYGLGSDPYDPANNILAGTAYLGELYRRFGSTGMFAAYNAGPERYQQFLDTGRSLPAETKAYLGAFNISVPATQAEPTSVSGQSLFFQLQDQAPMVNATRSDSSSGGLSVPLSPPESSSGAEKKGR
jgi:soluble lytic murein transglycosylase-like protein